MEKIADIFDGLTGQPRAREVLGVAYANGKLPQTMIFVGPKGTGRKTVAMMLARALHGQGQGSPSVRRDNKELRHPDTFIFSEVLAELRAQEQSSPIKRTTDAVMKFLSMSPIASKIKVAIIDEADSLSEESQNALLKTLEEPLADSVLILISEDEKRLLPTIVSRSVVVRFGPLNDADIKTVLPGISDEILKIVQGSLGLAKELLVDLEKLDEMQKMCQFWLTLNKQSTEDKLKWTEMMRERESAVKFLETGLRVIRSEWLTQPTEAGDRVLRQIRTAILQVKDNVNPRVAMEAMLLAL
ncbi:hypothetical protein A3K24_02945 [candidate division Kazan bacterium RIFCSPHIGHO2_01_FULL_44_14]|uniref:AAA+ ATPase domain-containing protein n=1 Tax=candidate division Kazan bacterium RIFCSPLOWO2_01_FULL_45_19 TaxID=1798538 RepID=A0A1F4NS89_UNCK3|nr:MAG: hypothetical protein A3K51_02945 [candidate division Kazan bacterium RIFCSPLOWO2_01_FULL_45_19]OGB78007.1 MAG: hypothetical protein A3K24_02945 [candidate division Kazan bacterium RIFCSPHIGHO2_01_FULL_44_14]